MKDRRESYSVLLTQLVNVVLPATRGMVAIKEHAYVRQNACQGGESLETMQNIPKLPPSIIQWHPSKKSSE